MKLLTVVTGLALAACLLAPDPLRAGDPFATAVKVPAVAKIGTDPFKAAATGADPFLAAARPKRPARPAPTVPPAPPEKPRVPPTPAGKVILHEDPPAAPKAAKACPCSPECTCGCNDGRPCRCDSLPQVVPYYPPVPPLFFPGGGPSFFGGGGVFSGCGGGG